MSIVILRDLQGIDLKTSTPTITLLSAADNQTAAGVRELVVSGLALNVGAVTISASTSAGRQNIAATVAASGHFVATLAGPVRSSFDFLILEAKDSAAGATAFDRCVVQLGQPGAPALANATLANVDPGTLSYLAGTPDRIIPSRTFVQLHLPIGLAPNLKLANLYFGTLNGAIFKLGADILKKTDVAVRKLADSVDKGKLPVDGYYAELEASISSILERHASPLPDAQAKETKARIHTALLGARPKTASNAGTSAKAASRPVQFGTGLKREAFLPGLHSAGKEAIGGRWAKGLRAAQRVGVLFSDRLRIVPVGLVVGEPLYKLALSPGEEVQLRQSSETRKRVSLSEIQDRESEQSLTLSSTLSTDLTTTVSDTRSFQSQVSLGGGLSGTIPETPIGVSVDAGTSASGAHSNSISETAAFHNETSSTSMARLRAQHKTTLEISSEQTTGYTTTRTLRNTNQQRSQIHTFFKLYRKERITLERHEAQLCLKFEVKDPAREVRSAFLSRFHRMDPNNSSNWDLPEYGDVLLTETRQPLTEPADQDSWSPLGGTHDRWRQLDIADIGTFLKAPAGYELIDKPHLTMTRVSVFTENSDLAGGEGSHVYEHALTRIADSTPHVDVLPEFTSSGGKVRAPRWPEPLGSNKRLTLDVSFAFRMDGHPPIVPFIERGSAITSVTFKVSATFGPGGALLQDRVDKVLRRKREAAAAFEPDSVYALAAAARADYPGSVINRAVAENFSHLGLEQMASVGRIFDLERSIIESVPYWANATAADTHVSLKILLERLPKPVDSAAVLTPELTGALAFVYLPVRHGMEGEALKLLNDLEAGQRSRLIDDFRHLRQTRFGLARPATGSPPADVPPHPAGTLAGAAAWSTTWETSMRKYELLAEWSDLTPTDGLHIETQLSATSVADEHARARLERFE